MLIFDSVSYRYSRFRASVLKEFSWQVPSGRTVLLGPNGAGKSTLLGLGSSLLIPDAGRVISSSNDVGRYRKRSSFRRDIGWMPQSVRAIPGFTVREQVAYAGWLKGMKQREATEAAISALELVDLSAMADQRASELSGGQLRRMGIAQVFIHRPKIVLLDEPSVGLDPDQRIRFRKLMIDLSDHAESVLVSTHQVDDIQDVFQNVAVLVGGNLLFQGSCDDFLGHKPHVDNGEEGNVAERTYARIVSREL